MLEDKNDLNSCPLSYTFSVIGGKWKPFIIWYLFKALPNTCRFGELKREIPWDISQKMFSQQLRELETAGIISRTEYDERPPRVEYTLTEAGKLLAPGVVFLRDWGAVYGENFTHSTLVDRTIGRVENDTIYYEYSDEAEDKKIEIKYKF